MNNIAKLLQMLETQIQHLHTQLNASKLINSDEFRFNAELFKKPVSKTTAKMKLADYFQEIEQNFYHLKTIVQQQDQKQHDKINYLTDKLVNQITALSREVATQKLRVVKEPKVQYETPHQVHSRYLDYQRRLLSMKSELELKLSQTSSFNEQREIQQQLATLEGRIYRCRIAIVKLESKLESDIVTHNK